MWETGSKDTVFYQVWNASMLRFKVLENQFLKPVY